MLKENIVVQFQKEAKFLRRTVLSMITESQASHVGSSYSIIELLVYLYSEVLKVSPTEPKSPNRDRFVLSKGWAISSLYAILAEKGFFEKSLLKEYCKDGSKMMGGSTINGIPGIEATTTSMGHGLPLGVGMALAGKIQQRDYRVVVLIGDGECDEGSTWEAILLAAHHKLDNLVVIIDYNKWQSFGKPEDVLNLEPLSDKWAACNWSVKECNGHDFMDIDRSLNVIPFAKDKPSVLIAHTIKGKGVSVFEDRNEWHYKTPKGEDKLIAEKELAE